MSFARVKPGGWALNEKLTSAQQNLLDVDHANALDKTGDTIASGDVIGVDGQININSGGELKALADGKVTFEAGSECRFKNGIAGALLVTDNTPMVVDPGSSLTVNGNTILTSTTVTTLSTSSIIAINPSVSRVRVCRVGISGQSPSPGPPLVWPYFVNGIGDAGAYWVQNSVADNPYMLFPIEAGHGSTLTNVKVVLRPVGGHAALPSTQPRVEIIRKQVDVDPANAWDAAGIETTVGFGAVVIGDYNDVNKLFDINLNMVINREAYAYFVRIYGEYGLSNTIVGMRVSYPRYTCTVNQYEEF